MESFQTMSSTTECKSQAPSKKQRTETCNNLGKNRKTCKNKNEAAVEKSTSDTENADSLPQPLTEHEAAELLNFLDKDDQDGRDDTEYIHACKGKFEFVIYLHDLLEIFESFNFDNKECDHIDLSNIRRLYKLYKNNRKANKISRFTIAYTHSCKTKEEAIGYRNQFKRSVEIV